MSTTAERVKALRGLMERQGLHAYLVPSSDPHQNEYVPECWQRRKFITGFSGSAGDALITRRSAGLWTDSRYFLQAAQQLDAKVYTMFRMGLPGVPSLTGWLAGRLKPGQVLGLDPQTLSHRALLEIEKALEPHRIRVRSVARNLVDAVWMDRPPAPGAPIEVHPKKYAGESAASKLERLRGQMAKEPADAHVVTKLDAAAWLFNIRGSDVQYNPVAVAYALVTPDKAMLFADSKKVSGRVRTSLARTAEILDYDEFPARLSSLAQQKARVWIDDGSASRWVVDRLKGARFLFKPSPIDLFKAVKNAVEIEGMRRAHIRDGAAVVRFLCWLQKAVVKGRVTEISAARRLEEFKRMGDLYRGPSFETISSYGKHGAVVHYAPTPESDVPIRRGGLYLIDAGGQYLDGTTDMTRTLAVGRPTAEQKDRFTRVLKGLMALTATPFPRGTAGKQLDTVARLPLWERGLNFLHGTGHGIGAFLNVHEGPQAISYYRCTGTALEPGMIQSIEPAFYKDGKYGLRTENVTLVVRDSGRSGPAGDFYAFETLTLCPIDSALVRKEMLTESERRWLDRYHDRVRRTLSPLLSGQERRWLSQATRPL